MRAPISHLIVRGDSMSPTLNPKDHLISLNWFYQVKEKDLVIALVNQIPMVKRVKKIQGEKLYLEGDNSSYSTDSRVFGWIEKSQLLGKVIFTIHS